MSNIEVGARIREPGKYKIIQEKVWLKKWIFLLNFFMR